MYHLLICHLEILTLPPKSILTSNLVVLLLFQILKPIFHQNAKLLALGTFASPNAKDRTFALPNARNTNMLVSLALGDANFLRRPCTFHFFGVDFFALGSKRKPHFQWNIGCVGSLALRWACTFHALGDANSTRRKPGFW